MYAQQVEEGQALAYLPRAGQHAGGWADATAEDEGHSHTRQL
jgi:hypothetical protein